MLEVIQALARVAAWIAGGGIVAIACLAGAWFFPLWRGRFLAGALLAITATTIYAAGVYDEHRVGQANLKRLQARFLALQARVGANAARRALTLDAELRRYQDEHDKRVLDYEARLANAAAGACALDDDDLRQLRQLAD